MKACGLSAASLEGYRRIAGGSHRGTLLETEQAWLAAVKPDLVVSDIVPLACAAAAAVGIPCVCISNFSWGAGPSAFLPCNLHSAAYLIIRDRAPQVVLCIFSGLLVCIMQPPEAAGVSARPQQSGIEIGVCCPLRCRHESNSMQSPHTIGEAWAQLVLVLDCSGGLH